MSEEFEFGRWKWTGSRLYVVGTGSLFVCEFEDREGAGVLVLGLGELWVFARLVQAVAFVGVLQVLEKGVL